MIPSRTALAAALMLAGGSALAAPFTAIRIGDIDGFGYTTDLPQLKAASGAAADTDGDNLIEKGEFLPDLPPRAFSPDGPPALGSPGDGVVQVTANLGAGLLGFDDFDNRSAADASGTNLGGSGFVDTGTTGSEYTDLSLSGSHGQVRVYSSPGVFSLPGSPPRPFPDAGGVALPNEPTFSFRFNVAEGDIDPMQQVFFNLLLGDYDVQPAEVQLVLNDGSAGAGSTLTLPLTLQGGTEDGLVQGAFATLSFSDVFSADPMGGWNGFLDVRVLAPVEPYLAFDFVELSTRPIINTPAPAVLPLMLLGFGAALAGLRRRRLA